MKKNYVIIVLGLGELAFIYKSLTKNWEEKFGIIPVIYIFGWSEKNAIFETKLQELNATIESLVKKDHSVSLIGISAGASASLNSYIVLKDKGILVKKYISICGRFNFDRHWWYPLSYGVERIPLFKKSVNEVIESIKFLDKTDYTKMKIFYSLFDEVVPNSASILPKAKKQMIPFPFHLAIYYLFLFPKLLTNELINL